MRVASLVSVVLLISAAPSGAALPQEAAAACEALGADAIFIGKPGKPAEVFVSFDDRIRPARERWLKAKAEADASKDTEVQIRAIHAFDDYESLRIRYPELGKMVLIPVEVETHFKGATPPLVYLQNMGLDELEPGRRYVFFSDFLMPPDMEDRILNPAGIPQPVEKAELTLRLISEALSASHGGTVIGSIEYESAGDPGNVATTNDRGEFEFRTIPQGSYLIGYELIVSGRWSSHPPLIYYPGTPDRVAAIPIVVGSAAEHSGIDFTVVW